MLTWRSFIHLLVSLLGLAGVQADALPAVTPGVSRRAFLQALGVSAAALAVMPASFCLDAPLDLDDALPTDFDYRQFDSVLKELYIPVITAELSRLNGVLTLMKESK